MYAGNVHNVRVGAMRLRRNRAVEVRRRARFITVKLCSVRARAACYGKAGRETYFSAGKIRLHAARAGGNAPHVWLCNELDVRCLYR
jgi:hypothetical protein